MKEYHILSWGGGTQSTALMLKMLKENKKLDYIVFADTMAENKLTYDQIYKVQKYVKDIYNKDIIITNKTKELLGDIDVIKLVKEGYKYRNSKNDNLFQSLILFFKGELETINVMPMWTRNKETGKVGKTPFKQCTFEYKLNQMYRELRKQIGVKSFSKNKHKLIMHIGYSYDEFSRYKDNPLSYADNKSPLIEQKITKDMCIKIVEDELGFTPRSSVCIFCFANNFEMVYDTYKTDKESWNMLLELDNVMENKPDDHPLVDDVFCFKFQADMNLRLKDMDMEKMKLEYDKQKELGQMSIFDFEQEWGCNEGCFL